MCSQKKKKKERENRYREKKKDDASPLSSSVNIIRSPKFTSRSRRLLQKLYNNECRKKIKNKTMLAICWFFSNP
jgi:hypothetical protein